MTLDAVAGRTAPILRSKTAPPPVRPDATIERTGLLRHLLASSRQPLVSVVAPAGYGKTTLLAQWAAGDPRPFAWLGVDEEDNDPVLLLRAVVATLEELPPSAQPDRPTRTTSLRALVSRIADLLRETAPAVLVLDDVHALEGPMLDLVGAIAHEVPPGSQLVLSGRRECTTVVARRRAAGDVVDVGQAELSLSDGEARRLLAHWGAELDEPQVEALVRANEGWAAGLYLAVLALRAGASFGADPSVDRFVHDYLRTEHLEQVGSEERSFLRRSSVLHRLRADLCDAVLERDDSGIVLRAIEDANLFLAPLDRERRWYRYHEIFRAVLFDELERVEPGLAQEQRRRAADWCEANGLPEDAITYAIASGDLDRVARLLVGLAFTLYRAGRIVTVESWLSHFDGGRRLQRYPHVATIGALVHALRGRAFQAERWLDAAGGAMDTGPLPDGSTGVGAWVATVEAFVCRHGPEQMTSDARGALRGLAATSPLVGPAMVSLAYASLIGGDVDAADIDFEQAHEAAVALGATFVATTCLAQRALLALDRGDLARAEELLAEIEVGEEYADYSTLAIILAARARVAAAAGRREEAVRRLSDAQRLRPSLTYALPYYGVICLLELARAYAALDDQAAARALLVQANDILRRRPSLGVLGARVEELQADLGRAATGGSGWEATLTAAELRLLPFLTTHLTFREIGERLFLSRNTVKTQAISIYRKLDASSRSEAVARAIELGLVERHDPGLFTPSG